MLENIRKATQSGVGRAIMTVLLGLLVVAFAIWGIGDIFRGTVSNRAIVVGGEVITADAIRTAYQQELSQYQRMLKTPITAAQAQALGIDRGVIETLETDAALDALAGRLGLSLSEAAIVDAVRANPAFQDAQGHFSADRFDAALREEGMTEATFFASQRRAYVRRQIEDAVAGDVSAPKALVEALWNVEAQTRAIDYVVLPSSAAGDLPPPSAEALSAFFEARKAAYRAPEYRALNVVDGTAAKLAKPNEVSDEDAKALYAKVKDQRYLTPEKRVVRQIVFANDAEATDAEAKIKAGATFDDIAKARNLSATDTDLGEMTKGAMYDPTVADAAFSLPAGGVSEVVKGPFGPVILTVTSITPGATIAYESVAADLKKEIAQQHAAEDALAFHDKIEDARTSGQSLEEAAKTVGLEASEIAAVDAQGLDKDGTPVDIPDKAEVLQAAFASDVGVDDAPIQTKDRGFVWFQVLKVEATRDRALDEIKARVEEDYHADAVGKALSAKAADLVKQLDGGADLSKIAQDLGLEKKSAADLRRSGGASLPQDVVADVFQTPPNGAGSAAVPDGRLVFKIVDDKTPPPSPADPSAAEGEKAAGRGLSQDVAQQFVSALKGELGVSVNEALVRAAIGG